MASALRIPGEELKELTKVNESVVQVARRLTKLAEESTNEEVAHALYFQAALLLDSSDTLTKAVNSVVAPLMK